jgi:hypothetical protein
MSKRDPIKAEDIAAVFTNGYRLGVDRERRRIRAKQRKAVIALRAAATVFNRPTLMNIAHAVDAATRATRAKRSKR